MYYPSLGYRNYTISPNSSRTYGRMIKVTGKGTVFAEPTVVKINIGVVTEDQDLTVAQQNNATQMEQVIQALIQLGIPNENIRTVDYYIYPQYDYVDGKQVFSGYQVTHMIQVTMENLKLSGVVIDTAVKNGANRVSNIDFTIENHQEYYQEALTLALRDAITKAQTITSSMELTLDPNPVKIIEQTQQPVSAPSQTLVKAEAVSATPTPIEPGQLEISAQIETTFQYI